MDSFYMVLPSNVDCKDYFPNNNLSNYTTKLPHRLHLGEGWEVGVAEISYTYSWLNVPTDKKIKFMCYNEHRKAVDTYEFVMSKGQYSTVEDLALELNNCFAKLKDALAYNTIVPKAVTKGQRIDVINGTDSNRRLIHVHLDDNLAGMLGIKNHKNKRLADEYFNEVKNSKDSHPKITDELKYQYGATYTDLMRGVYALYLYSDIIMPTFVGNTYSQIMRVVEIPSYAKHGQQVNIKYPTPFFYPVNQTEFETIEIHVKDDTNKDIGFHFGRIIVTLHFRKKLISIRS